MSMRKYADGEGKLEVLRGREANALNAHMERLGKFSVSDFSDDEREALQADLEKAREEDENEQRASEANDDVQGEAASPRGTASKRTPKSRANES